MCPCLTRPTLAAATPPPPPQVLRLLKDRRKFIVVATAPSVRVAIGEELGLAPGAVPTGQMVAALRKLGFDKVRGGEAMTCVDNMRKLASGGVEMTLCTSYGPLNVCLLDKH